VLLILFGKIDIVEIHASSGTTIWNRGFEKVIK